MPAQGPRLLLGLRHEEANVSAMTNVMGRAFRVATWGESHGLAVGALVDGVPAGLELSREDIQRELDKRRPGQNSLVTSRSEPDKVEILSGVVDGYTLGTPIMMEVRNLNPRSSDYARLATVYRPSHGDYTWQAKYGCRDYRGGGRASARETVGRVAAGAIAKKLMQVTCQVETLAWAQQIGSAASSIPVQEVTSALVEQSLLRCPDKQAEQAMANLIESVRQQGDSLGGVVQLRIKSVPSGLGEPLFDKLEALLAAAMLSIPACVGFEVGEGFACVERLGSENNDQFAAGEAGAKFATNHNGGIQAGISNGQDILCRLAFKPTPSISRVQQAATVDGQVIPLSVEGRHDVCVVPRAVPVVEAMANLVLADCYLMQRCSRIGVG